MAQTTKLAAVNRILAAQNESPVNSLGSSPKAAHAETVLDEVSNEVQMEGWEFNTEFDVQLTLNSDNSVSVPNTTARIYVPNQRQFGGSSVYTRYVYRDGKLYDRKEKSFTSFTSAPKVTLVKMLPFADIPEVAKTYVILRASRRASMYQRPNPLRDSLMLRNELQAYSTLTEHEGLSGDFTIFDNSAAYRALDREPYTG